MELRVGRGQARSDEEDAVASVLGPPRHVEIGGGALRSKRHLLLGTLHAVNDRVGWISRAAIDLIAARLDVAPADIFAVASFYGLFSMEERSVHQTHVCVDLACRAAGGMRAEDLAPGAHPSPCLGVCERAPAALVIRAGSPPLRAVAAPVSPADIARFSAGKIPDPEAPVNAAIPQAWRRISGESPPNSRSDQGFYRLSLLRRVGFVDPASLDDYLAAGGFAALHIAFEIGPGEVVREVTESGLVGRGGAAFPTGRKWDAVARQPATPHHLVCNADESEPGTFKDRVLIEGDPFALIEAMTICAYATGCAHGWIYLRGEYPRAERTLRTALDVARGRGYLGTDIAGSAFDFDITLVRGAGAYICGEETAIFNSIEGYRGEPRNKPPYPSDAGLFDQPTVVNNVETLLNVLPILSDGSAAFKSVGTPGSTGTKLFCVSGSVSDPGVYEVPFGTTLRELIDCAGGLRTTERTGASLRAVLLGGAAGGFVGPEDLDLELSLEAARAAGTTLGSGVVLVLDDSVDLVDQLTRIAAFFRDESCGQCVPCRVGTVRQEEIVAKLAGGDRSPDTLALLGELRQVMIDASICGLGQTAPNAIESAIVRLGVFR